MAHNGKSGWLWKWTNYVQGYQKRWCVIVKGTLSYYRTKEEVETTCRGSIKLPGSSVVIVNSTTFVVSNGASHIFHFIVDSDKDLPSWIAALENEKHKPSTNNEKSHLNKNLTDDYKIVQTPTNTTHSNVSIVSLRSRQNDVEDCFKLMKKYDDEFRQMTQFGVDGNKEKVLLSLKSLESSSHALCQVTTVFRNEVCALQRHVEDEDVEAAKDLDSDSDVEYVDADDKNLVVPASSKAKLRVRRSRIPFKKNYSLNMALWGMIKNANPRELYRVAVPVQFNEPLSTLQRFAEDMEYSFLLDKAAECTDSCLQLAHVVAFSVSGYSTTRHRSTKPFNPLLGETYECVRDDQGYKLIAEQVSHHPPSSALHSESTKGLWSYWVEWSIETKFCGNYVKAYPIGSYHCIFHDTGHHYTWKKVNTNVHNIIIGKLWIDQDGESEVINHVTGDRCLHNYTPYKMFGTSEYRSVNGIIKNGNNEARYVIKGFWDSYLNAAEITNETTVASEVKYDTKTPRRLWTVNKPIEKSEYMYNFSAFSITLNEMEDGVAPTDSRLRPDQRLMEDGDWDEANRIKVVLENMQRKRRREKEDRNKKLVEEGLEAEEHIPLWFERTHCSLTNEESFVYNKTYWECKQKQDWSKCIDIFALE